MDFNRILGERGNVLATSRIFTEIKRSINNTKERRDEVIENMYNNYKNDNIGGFMIFWKRDASLLIIRVRI